MLCPHARARAHGVAASAARCRARGRACEWAGGRRGRERTLAATKPFASYTRHVLYSLSSPPSSAIEPPTITRLSSAARRASAQTEGEAEHVASSPTDGHGSAYSPNAAVAYGPFHTSGSTTRRAPPAAALRTMRVAVAMLAVLSSVTANWQTPMRDALALAGAADAALVLRPRATHAAPMPTAAARTHARAIMAAACRTRPESHPSSRFLVAPGAHHHTNSHRRRTAVRCAAAWHASARAVRAHTRRARACARASAGDGERFRAAHARGRLCGGGRDGRRRHRARCQLVPRLDGEPALVKQVLR